MKKAFTLPELLLAVGIFAVVASIVSGLYISTLHSSKKINSNNQIFDDARYIMGRIADEIRNGAIDYDEYYSQNVAIPSGYGNDNFGQNFGRYYSSFFHPGSDGKLGFDCNDVSDGGARNRADCTPMRRTVDRNTGANPFNGKYAAGVDAEEDAFCGTVSYGVRQTEVTGRRGLCGVDEKPDKALERAQPELYLISADGHTKTVLAAERIGGSVEAPIYALSILRMKGIDTDNDSVADSFECADDFQCTDDDDDCAAILPRLREEELTPNNAQFAAETCDPATSGFSNDFVPISPLRVNIKDINFEIYPTEDPNYAFSEIAGIAVPRVTVTLTIEPNTEALGSREEFLPITFTETIASQILTPVPAPVLIE